MSSDHDFHPRPFDLTGQRALITGSSRGIGEAIARQMARAGAKVIISSRNQEACDAVAQAINEEGGEALAIAGNVGRTESIDELMDKAESAWGGIDILVANAAANPHYGPLTTITDAQFDKIIDVNLRGQLHLCRRALPGMASRGDGSVILVSSISAYKGTPGLGAYSISKAADLQLTRALAVEWGTKGVRINALVPGLVRTDFARALWENPDTLAHYEHSLPMGRIGEPDDLAGAAVFLASPAARWMTGQQLVVDGGRTIVE